jgi:hypothetical protein
MQWNRSITIGVSRAKCSVCHGIGVIPSRSGTEAPCNCVLRNIFRACWIRFRECVALEYHPSAVSLDFVNGLAARRSYSRKREDFAADFCLVSRRTLEEGIEYDIFRFHYLLGANWKMCCKRLNMDRGTFFHHVYRIEQKLGRAFAEVEPYALFPLDDYFIKQVYKELVSPCVPPKPARLSLAELIKQAA